MMNRRPVRVLVVGGMTRLEPFYRDAPENVSVDVASVDSGSLEDRASAADALVLVVGTVSHSAAEKIRDVSRRRGKPLTAATGPSVSRVRAAIASAFLLATTARAS